MYDQSAHEVETNIMPNNYLELTYLISPLNNTKIVFSLSYQNPSDRTTIRNASKQKCILQILLL